MNNYYKNRHMILARRAEYYEQNKQMISERNKIYFKAYYDRNRQKMITRSSEYQKKHCKKKQKKSNTLNLKFDQFIIDLTEY